MKQIPLFFFITVLSFGCQHKKASSEKQEAVSAITGEQLMAINKANIAEENDQIDALVLRYKWPVNTTVTGVRYWIYEKGNGAETETGDNVSCKYSIKLITGDEIYNSDQDGLLLFQVGKSDLPSGLEEVILLMRQGDRAKIVVPSYLAYGIAGDGNKIPPVSTLIYDINIIKVNH